MYLFIILLLWRLILFGVSFLTLHFTSFVPQFPYSDVYLVPSGLPNWFWSWANFDGVHYLGIAQKGYFAQFTQAFFPLFPIILGFAGRIVNDRFFIISGLILSFLFFYAALYFFVKLLRYDYEPKQIRAVIVGLLLFPTSYYFAALYSESLFFLLTILAFLCARKKKWLITGVIGACASATRVSGILLLPVLLSEWLMAQKFQFTFLERKQRNITTMIKNIINDSLNIIRFSLRSPVLYIVPLGLLAYMGYLQFVFHDALYFFHAQPAFGAARSTELISPLQVLYRYAKILMTVPLETHAFFVAIIELIAFFIAISLLIIASRKKVRFSYILFGWGVLLLPVITGTLSSMPRYILLIFPMYIVFSTFDRKVLWLLYGLSIIFSVMLTAQFIRGVWVA